MPDVVVVGGGVIGCGVGRALAREGLGVVVLERGRPGGEATWAAAGMLSPLGESSGPGPFLDLGVASLAEWPDFAATVEEESGIDIGFRRSGKLLVAADAEREAALRERRAWLCERDHQARWLSATEVREVEPAVSDDVRGGLLLPREAQVDNRRLGRALWTAAGRRGADVRPGVAVRRLLASGGRVEGVGLDDGTRLRTGWVVLAAGAWSGDLRGLPRSLPVTPVRGAMLALESVPPVLRHIVEAGGVYLIPRDEGRILAGATVERAGFHTVVTAGGLAGLLRATLEVVPGLASHALAEVWAGLRPGTPDDLPILGPDPEIEGLLYATGHFRNGILLAPVTAGALADLLSGRAPAHDLHPFRPDRFEATPPTAAARESPASEGGG